METILVTGGAGFIGSHVCDKLLQLGKKVICIDNLNPYYSPIRKIKNIKHNFDNPNFVFYNVDIQDKDQLEEIFKKHKIDKICHLAARAGVRPSIEKPLWYRDTNVTGTLNLLELAKEFKVHNFIFASSSSVYGKNKKIPFSETDNVDYPISPYAASKKACELFCYTYSHLVDLNVTCLRFFTVYGPRGRPDMAPYLFTKRIMKGLPIKKFGDGTSKRDYTYISDIVDGVMAALERPFKFEIINLGNNKPVELNHFISVIEGHLGKKAIIEEHPMPAGDVPITFADTSKAKGLLDYEPKVSIEEGMKRFIEWFKQEGLDRED
ncbi:epimerase [Candidatus Woesearchaeota archaeon]|nr:MAG: epimerase [Candidatus Woesearchaeota archaeon]